MFSYLKSIKSKPCDVISITQLVNLIKNYPDKNLINKLWSFEYGSKEYKEFKTKMPAVKINGSFSSLNGSSIQKLNNYFYFDIDNTNLSPETIVNKYPFISLITKSVGGKGIFFLVKISNIELDVLLHTNIHKYMIKEIFKDLNIDLNATGISRNVIIPSYENVIWNDVSYNIDINLYNEWYNRVNNVKNLKTKHREKEEILYGLNEPLSNELIFKTKYDKEIEKLYNIDEIDFAEIRIPNIIKDGTKHKLYAALVNQIIYLNPYITLEQTINFISMINNDKGQPPMNIKRLIQLVTWTYNNITTTGEIKAKTRKKKIQFKMDKKLTVKEKQSIAAKANGALRTNSTIDKIQEAIDLLLQNNEKVTNKRLVELTGLSLATIKRNKLKEKTDPMSFNDYVKPEGSIIENNLPQISEKDFWGE